ARLRRRWPPLCLLSRKMPTFPVFPVIVIVGPTAAGKTAVAIDLATKIDTEIISADSRQFYKMMDIGTAKPSAEELRQAKHHFIDFLHPTAEYSAGDFSREARKLIQELRSNNKNVIVAGGSGMYITALLDGFFAPIAKDKDLQQKLKKHAQEEGSKKLYQELQRFDPERAAELHPNDAHRIVRALEVYYATGTKLSSLRAQPRIPADFRFVQFGLNWKRESLYKRIESRVDEMIASGLQKEVDTILARGVSADANALQTLGYKEMIQFLRGELQHDEMVEKIKQQTRNFAKRQMTWFRKDDRIRWIDVDESSFSAIPGEIFDFINEERPDD
ncbi:MAG: tRNA (adenosine(37)-N6)-dimethylallyltransferase MiaA, partial [bacterium]